MVLFNTVMFWESGSNAVAWIRHWNSDTVYDGYPETRSLTVIKNGFDPPQGARGSVRLVHPDRADGRENVCRIDAINGFLTEFWEYICL